MKMFPKEEEAGGILENFLTSLMGTSHMVCRHHLKVNVRKAQGRYLNPWGSSKGERNFRSFLQPRFGARLLFKPSPLPS
ncbi:hypothetical protein Ac2012v2_005244 [Leucoagaricus gongylophorus]